VRRGGNSCCRRAWAGLGWDLAASSHGGRFRGRCAQCAVTARRDRSPQQGFTLPGSRLRRCGLQARRYPATGRIRPPAALLQAGHCCGAGPSVATARVGEHPNPGSGKTGTGKVPRIPGRVRKRIKSSPGSRVKSIGNCLQDPQTVTTRCVRPLHLPQVRWLIFHSGALLRQEQVRFKRPGRRALKFLSAAR